MLGADPEGGVMAQSVPPQHPAVVLRSHYVAVRALLAVAMFAVVVLACTVVLLGRNLR
jgi:hypothetical protein